MKSTLKRLSIILFAVILFSCTGKEKQPKVKEYQYVEPTENISQMIWEKLVAEDEFINKNMELAKNYEGYRDTKPEPQYPSKTSMIYYHTGYEFDGDIDELAFFQMQCYQMKDQSWIAVIYDQCVNYAFDPYRRDEFYFRHYKDGVFVDDQPQIDLPTECPQNLMSYASSRDQWHNCVFEFDTVGFVMNPHKFWPIRYDWNGEKFVMNPNSVVLANCFNHGVLEPYNFSRTTNDGLNYYDFKVDNNYMVRNGNTGEGVLQLTFDDIHLSEIAILSPRIGIAFADEEVSHPLVYSRRPTSLPVALGQPIQNVIDSKKSDAIYNEITESTKDGLYTLTQHLKVDKDNHKDVFAEYQAKDKNSPIEKFRVYTQPLALTLDSELAENSRVSDDAKQFWALINADNAVTNTMPGKFKNLWDTSSNGFDAIFRDENDNGGYVDWRMTFVMYAVNDGSKIAYIRRVYYDCRDVDRPEDITPEWEQYVYQNGTLNKVQPRLPEPQLDDFIAYRLGKTDISIHGERSEFYFDCGGCFSYIAHADEYDDFGDGSPDAYLYYYEAFFEWDGEKFVNTRLENYELNQEANFEEDYEEDYEE